MGNSEVTKQTDRRWSGPQGQTEPTDSWTPKAFELQAPPYFIYYLLLLLLFQIK